MMQGVQNKIDVTFEQSKSAFTITVYLVQKNTVGQLVEKIRKRGFISKEATLNKSMLSPEVFGGLLTWVSESGGTGCGYYAWARDVDFEGSDFDDEGYITF